MNFKKSIKKFAAITLIGAMTVLTINPISAHAQSISDVSVNKPTYGLVSTNDGSGLNVRDAANLTTSNIITTVPSSSRLMIVGSSGNFYKVQYDANGHYGYASMDYLTFVSTGHYLKANTSSNNLNMREKPSTSSSIIASIPKNTGFAYVSTGTNWYRGVYGNQCGYTSKDYTSFMSY